MQVGVCVRSAMAMVGLVLGTTLGTAGLAHADSISVKIAQGKVQGKAINAGKVHAFLGLPYAAPPVGQLRWQPPQPAPHWRGTLDAVRYGAHCWGHESSDMVFQDSGPSENCLYLNVFAPADATAKSKLPVMFWIHGGGFRAVPLPNRGTMAIFCPPKVWSWSLSITGWECLDFWLRRPWPWSRRGRRVTTG